MSNRKWLFVFVALFLIFGTAAFFIHRHEGETKIAKIYVNHEVVKTIDLNKVKAPYVFRVDTGNGDYNEIEVRPGKIAIVKANCPDQICVHQGAISSGIEPIVCLPHKLIIRIEGEDKAIHGGHSHDHDHDHDHGHDGGSEDLDTVTK